MRPETRPIRVVLCATSIFLAVLLTPPPAFAESRDVEGAASGRYYNKVWDKWSDFPIRVYVTNDSAVHLVFGKGVLQADGVLGDLNECTDALKTAEAWCKKAADEKLEVESKKLYFSPSFGVWFSAADGGKRATINVTVADAHSDITLRLTQDDVKAVITLMEKAPQAIRDLQKNVEKAEDVEATLQGTADFGKAFSAVVAGDGFALVGGAYERKLADGVERLEPEQTGFSYESILHGLALSTHHAERWSALAKKLLVPADGRALGEAVYRAGWHVAPADGRAMGQVVFRGEWQEGKKFKFRMESAKNCMLIVAQWLDQDGTEATAFRVAHRGEIAESAKDAAAREIAHKNDAAAREAARKAGIPLEKYLERQKAEAAAAQAEVEAKAQSDRVAKAKADAAPVYVLKDGRRIKALTVVDGGDVYSIKDDHGKFVQVPKADVTKVESQQGKE